MCNRKRSDEKGENNHCQTDTQRGKGRPSQKNSTGERNATSQKGLPGGGSKAAGGVFMCQGGGVKVPSRASTLYWWDVWKAGEGLGKTQTLKKNQP